MFSITIVTLGLTVIPIFHKNIHTGHPGENDSLSISSRSEDCQQLSTCKPYNCLGLGKRAELDPTPGKREEDTECRPYQAEVKTER